MEGRSALNGTNGVKAWPPPPPNFEIGNVSDTMTKYDRPTRIEGEIWNLEVVEGEIPKDISGAFYRVQPEPNFPSFVNGDIVSIPQCTEKIFKTKHRLMFELRVVDQW
jgi:hypothetical protein